MKNQFFFKPQWFKNKLKYIFILCISIVFSISSCVKEGDFEFDKLAENQFDPTIAAPFVNSRLMLKDILKDTSGIIQTDILDNSLKIVYNLDNMVSIMAKDLFVIPNQSIPIDTANINLVSSGVTSYFSITKPYSFQLPDTTKNQRIDSIFIKTAFLKLSLKTNINHSWKLKVTLPDVIKPNGDTLIVELDVNYTNQSLPYTTIFNPINLSGCKIRFKNSIGKKNELIVKMEQWVYADNNPYNNPYYIQLSDNLDNITYDKLIGYIGPYDYTVMDTMKIQDDHIKDLLEHIDFYKVGISADIKNSYGLPINIHIDTILAKANSGNYLVTNFPNSSSTITVNYPSINNLGQSVATQIPYTENQSLINAINKKPNEIIFKVTGKLNPNSNPNIPNFVIDTSKFTVGVHVELPLEGKVAGFVLEDTIGFDLASKLKDLDEVSFKINTSNAFPLDAFVQVYFANPFGKIIDSLIVDGQNVINSGFVNANHIVTMPTHKTTDVSLSAKRVRDIEKGNPQQLIIKARLTSYNGGANNVKITNDNYLDVKLGMKAKVILKPQGGN
jgi:hypothetical protein